jgi:hypothetical protein
MRTAAKIIAIALLVAPATANAQFFSTVMLPSQSQFGVSTTVSVPDSGGILLGSVNRSANGYVSRGFGPFTNRAFGKSLGSSTVSAHVYVIDLGEMDRRMQEEAAAMREAGYHRYVMAYPKVAQAAKITNSGRTAQAATTEVKRVTSGMSLAAQRQLADDEDATELAVGRAEAMRLLEKATEAEKSGKPAIAKSKYLAAAKRGDGEIRQLGLEGYRRILAATSREIAQP